MRLLCWELVMCERKAKKDAPAAMVSRAACIFRVLPADASRPALLGWGRKKTCCDAGKIGFCHCAED